METVGPCHLHLRNPTPRHGEGAWLLLGPGCSLHPLGKANASARKVLSLLCATREVLLSQALGQTPVTWVVRKAAGTVPSSGAKPSRGHASQLPCALPGTSQSQTPMPAGIASAEPRFYFHWGWRNSSKQNRGTMTFFSHILRGPTLPGWLQSPRASPKLRLLVLLFWWF